MEWPKVERLVCSNGLLRESMRAMEAVAGPRGDRVDWRRPPDRVVVEIVVTWRCRACRRLAAAKAVVPTRALARWEPGRVDRLAIRLIRGARGRLYRFLDENGHEEGRCPQSDALVPVVGWIEG